MSSGMLLSDDFVVLVRRYARDPLAACIVARLPGT